MRTDGFQGHKRWEKAVSTGYENVRRLTHECLLPALERCEVLLSRLIGLSKFHKLSEVLGLETSGLNAIVETLDCLHLLAHNILIYTNEELSQFNAFSRWLRHEIDMQSAEPMSQTLEELMDKTDLVEYPQTLKYIRGALTKSALRHFVQQLPMMGQPRPPPAASDKWAPTGHDRSFYDKFKKLLEHQVQSSNDENTNESPKLNDLTRRLGLQFEKVFGQIALTQRRGILHRSPLSLHADCDTDVADMAMEYEVIRHRGYPTVGLLLIILGRQRSKLMCDICGNQIRQVTPFRFVMSFGILAAQANSSSSLRLPRGPRLRERR